MSDQKPKKQGRKKTPELVDVERLRKLIDTKKSRQEIADAIGCDVSTITKHYNGNNPVDIEWLYKYAQYFNVSTDYLLGLSESEQPDAERQVILHKVETAGTAYIFLDEKAAEQFALSLMKNGKPFSFSESTELMKESQIEKFS